MKKGDKVICTNGTFHSRSTDPFTKEQLNLPETGQVYTIREIVKTEEGPGIRLKEIVNNKFQHERGGLQEPAFDMKRFKPCESH